MPIVVSRFRPSWFLRNGHVQTILPVLWSRKLNLRFERERLEIEDGDFLDLDWLRAGKDRLVILSHGLEGSTRGGYIRGMAAALAAAGWDVMAWNFRGCSGEANRLPRSYHSGESGDLRRVIQHASPGYPEISLIGFSLGGNVTLKYLGEAPPHPSIKSAVAISVPVDLATCARALDERPGNRIYRHRFLATLKAKMHDKALRFAREIDVRGLGTVRTFREFDNRFTAPLHGFNDAADYWTRSSSKQFLLRITVPTLLLSARNDPLLSPESFPEAEAAQNQKLFLEAPDTGGHVGFVDFATGIAPWTEARAVEFLAQATRRS
jgi:hypothetical protein